MSQSENGWQRPPQFVVPPAPAIRSNEALGIALVVLSVLAVCAPILSAVTAPAAIHAYDAAIAAGRDPAEVTTAHDLVGLLELVFVPTWIVGSLWLSRARRNATILAPGHVRRSAVWCWLGWFMPVVSWWFPKTIVDDSLEVATTALPGESSTVRPRLTALWWGLWITYITLGYISARIAPEFTGHARRGVVPALEVLVAIAAVAALAAWIPVVRTLTQLQTELVRRGPQLAWGSPGAAAFPAAPPGASGPGL